MNIITKSLHPSVRPIKTAKDDFFVQLAEKNRASVQEDMYSPDLVYKTESDGSERLISVVVNLLTQIRNFNHAQQLPITYQKNTKEELIKQLKYALNSLSLKQTGFEKEVNVLVEKVSDEGFLADNENLDSIVEQFQEKIKKKQEMK